MASKPPISRPATGVIGPGQYYRSDDPNNFSPAVTIPRAGRSQLVDPEGSGAPGPGHYNSAESTLNKGGVSFKGKSSALLVEKNEGGPGPGQYHKYQDLGARGYSIPKAERDGTGEGNLIGPGHYATTEGLGKHGISIPRTGREPGYSETQQIGPGAYNIDRGLGNQGQGSFGRQPRQLIGEGLSSTGELGPGAYVGVQGFGDKKKGPTIRGKPRPNSAAPGSRLGPGQYYSQQQNGIPASAYSFGKGNRDHGKNQGGVGPGQYGTMRPKNNGKGITFGRSTRMAQKSDNLVGPGQYCQQKPLNKNARPATSKGTFGNAERKIGERLQETGAAANLGPGYYSIKEKNKNGWKFGNEKRDGHYKSDNPVGPGAYTIQSELNLVGGAIGRAPREKPTSNSKGGNMYQIPSSIPDVPKYLLPPPNKRKIHI